MMNNLKKQHLIINENLSAACYFQSILQQGYQLKLLTNSELENIQLQSIQLLTKQTEQYTHGKSSSVKVETAQNILQSIIYSIGIYLKSFRDADLSFAALKQKPLLEMYQHGKKLIEEQLDSAKELLDTVQKNCIVTDNVAYNDTIQNGLSIFFSAYDVDFTAHDTPGSIDYPLSSDNTELAGIEYIYNYLEKLFLENQFCQKFAEHDIQCLLQGYNEHYQDLLINIFELVLANALGCILANKNLLQLNIESLDRKNLYKKLVHLPKEKLDLLLQDASTKLCRDYNISDQSLQKYIYAAAMNLLPKLMNALENNQLESIFISLKEKPSQSLLLFEEGKKMNDDLFRYITNEIRDCRLVSDKIAIIQKEVHSTTDLVDILGAYCIFDDEFDAVFQSLGDMELALLSKRLSKHITDLDLHFTEHEKEWQCKLTCFLNKMDITKRETIKKLAEKVETT